VGATLPGGGESNVGMAGSTEADIVLQKMIEEALLLVQAEPQHDLKLGFCCRLLSTFDEIDGARCP
jgi:hypothetical protein